MGGFRKGPKVRKITFDDDTEFSGLWIRIGGITIDEWFDMTHVDAYNTFTERLIEWNWEDDNGNPVPPTKEAIGRLDASDMRTLIAHWVRVCSERRDTNPLVSAEPAMVTNGSSGPDPDLEAEIRMLPTSESSSG